MIICKHTLHIMHAECIQNYLATIYYCHENTICSKKIKFSFSKCWITNVVI